MGGTGLEPVTPSLSSEGAEPLRRPRLLWLSEIAVAAAPPRAPSFHIDDAARGRAVTAVASAMTSACLSIALRKTVLGCPCEVVLVLPGAGAAPTILVPVGLSSNSRLPR